VDLLLNSSPIHAPAATLRRASSFRLSQNRHQPITSWPRRITESSPAAPQPEYWRRLDISAHPSITAIICVFIAWPPPVCGSCTRGVRHSTPVAMLSRDPGPCIGDELGLDTAGDRLRSSNGMMRGIAWYGPSACRRQALWGHDILMSAWTKANSLACRSRECQRLRGN